MISLKLVNLVLILKAIALIDSLYVEKDQTNLKIKSFKIKNTTFDQKSNILDAGYKIEQANSLVKDSSFKRKYDHLAELDPYAQKNYPTSFAFKQKLKPSIQKETKSRGINHIHFLYKRLKEGNSIYNDKSINTIRFIPSIRSTSYNKLTFQFNLSLLSTTEKLIKVELFLNKKFIKSKLKLNLKYQLDQNKMKKGPMTIIDLAEFKNGNGNFLKPHSGWQMFNIIDSANSYFMARNNKEKLSRIALDNRKNNTVYYTVTSEFNLNSKEKSGSGTFLLSIEAYISGRNKKSLYNSDVNDLINPYLIVYSMEDEQNMKNFFQNRLPFELKSQKIDAKEKLNDLKFRQNYISDEELLRLKSFEHEVDKMNELNEENDKETPSVPFNYFSNADKSIKIFEPFENYKHSKSAYYDYSPKSEYKIEGTSNNSNVQELEFLLGDLKAEKIYKKTSKRDVLLDDSQFNLLPSSNWQFADVDADNKKIRDDKFSCKAQPIVIDFEDLSFSNWILEPKSFQSNYCSGTCEFPLNERMSYSNYATLQSILNSINMGTRRNSLSSELCCTPSKTEPVSIFYKDVNSIDYVVKLLPDMIVNECACH